MPAAAMRVLEYLASRRGLWRLSRRMYFHVRRDGDGDPATNGEYGLHRAIVNHARKTGKPLTVVDVGGFTGYWSLHLLNTCQEAGLTEVSLVVFEPSDESRAKLLDRLKAAPSQYRVKVRTEAVSDRAGVSAFDIRSTRVGTQRLLPDAEKIDAGIARADVTVTTLAAVFEEEGIREADYVKSDVEGFDLGVMQGARPLLEQGRIGVLQFEYNHCWIDTRTFLVQVFELVETLPYSVCKIVPEGLERFAAWHPEMETFFDGNYALVRNDLLGAFGVAAGGFDKFNTFGTDTMQPAANSNAPGTKPAGQSAPLTARLARSLRGLRRVRGWERAVAALGRPPTEPTPFVVKNASGYFAGDLSSFIDRRMYLFGHYEEELIGLFVSQIPAGRRRTILDVGANVGTHSLAFSHHFKAVHSFEPNPKLWASFEENVRLNGFSNVTLHKLGLADKIGEIPFYNIDNKNAGLGTCSPDELYDQPLQLVGTVKVLTGDGFVASENVGPVDAIKIDVQGFELSVIRGLQETLARDKPFVWLEIGGPTAKDFNSLQVLKGLFPYPTDVFRFEIHSRGLVNAARLTKVVDGALKYGDYLVSPASGTS